MDYAEKFECSQTLVDVYIDLVCQIWPYTRQNPVVLETALNICAAYPITLGQIVDNLDAARRVFGVLGIAGPGGPVEFPLYMDALGKRAQRGSVL